MKRPSKKFVALALCALLSIGVATAAAFIFGKKEAASLTVSAGSDYHGENKTVRLGELSSDGDVCDVGKISILERLKI